MIFDGLIGFITDQGITKKRKQILVKQVKEKGGVIQDSYTTSLTHIIVSKSMKYHRLLEIFKIKEIPSSILVLDVEWITSCLVAGQRLDATPYILRPDQPHKPNKLVSTMVLNEDVPLGQGTKPSAVPEPSIMPLTAPTQKQLISPSKRKLEIDSDSDYVQSDDEEGGATEEGVALTLPDLAEQGLVRPPPKKGKWMCQVPSSELHTQANHNTMVTDKLEELLLEYKNSNLSKDKWRANSLTKALAAIKRHPKPITSYEEAYSIPFVGKRVADKIYEIVSSGHLRRLDHIDKDKQIVIDLFKGVHGIGQVLAEQYYAQGYRTLQELKDANILNRQQLIGLKYYDEFKERMSRNEVKQIEDKVIEGCNKINSSLQVVTCGSYRRGKPTCGDVDILITHPDGRSHKGIFTPLIELLKHDGFLTDDLTTHEDTTDGSCKYFGVCILPGPGQKHRRIDIYICPYSEYPLMLLHFTGSGHFNRSIRHRADKMGMSLSEHSLNVGVIRKNGVKVFEGTPVPVFSEEDVFKYLQLDYLEPHDRDLD